MPEQADMISCESVILNVTIYSHFNIFVYGIIALTDVVDDNV